MGINERPKWMIAAVAAIAATGVGGVVLASDDLGRSLPDSVNLRDGVPVASATFEATANPFERTSPIVRAEAGSFTISGDSISGDSVTGDSISGDSITGDSITGDSLSADSISGDSISADSLSVDSMSGDSVSVDSVDDSVSDDSI